MGEGHSATMIAAIAMSRKAIALTRNLSDFERITELQAEDWSV
ncbi:hypothetical protein [Leptolyngbya sp. AS-A5]